MTFAPYKISESWFLGVEAILTTKLEVRVLQPKVNLFGKSYFYFKKC
jgi:hypothetical protein